MDEDNDEGQTMARRDTGDWEGGDPFAGATGTFIVHLFDCGGDEHGDTRSGGQRRGDGKRRQPRAVAGVGDDGLRRRRLDHIHCTKTNEHIALTITSN